MSQSLKYEVIARYQVRAERAQQQTERLARKTEQASRAIDRTERSSSRLTRALMVIVPGAALAGLAKILKMMKDLKQEAEDAEISIAGTFKTLSPNMSFNGAMDRATDLMQRFRDAAITSPATSRDFQRAFTNAAPMLAGLGLSNQGITQAISRLVPAAVAFTGGDFDQAGRDMREVLDGRLNLDNRTFAPLRKRIMEEAKVKDTKAFSAKVAKDPEVALRAVMSVLGSMDDVNKAFARSFTGLSSSIQEYIDRFLRRAGGGLFEALKKQMGTMVDFFEKNQTAINRVADVVGGALVKAFKLATAGAQFLVDNMKALLTISTVLAARKLGGLALAAAAAPAGALRGGVAALASGAAYRNVGAGAAALAAGGAGMVGRGFGALRAAPGRLLGGAKNLAMMPLNLLGDALTAGPMVAARASIQGQAAPGRLAMLGGTLSAMGKTSGLTALVSGFMALVKVIPPIVIVIGMVVGAMQVLKDKTNDATIFFNNAVSDLFESLDKLAMQMGGSGGFSQTIKDIVTWLGTGVVGVMGLAVTAVQGFVESFSIMAAVIKGVGLGIGMIFSVYETYGAAAALRPGLIANAFKGGMARAFKEREDMATKAAQKRYEDEEKKRKLEETTKKKGKPSVQVTVIQDIKTDADPDRIAFKVGEVVRDTFEKFPATVSGLAGVSGV